MLRDRVNLVVALLAAIVAVVTALVLPGGWYVLTAGILASAVGAWLAQRQQLVQKELINENS
jgi:predicted branched-subunit amino acid permease